MALTWWEKTVEWRFVLEVLGRPMPQGLPNASAAPLSGVEERFGDAWLSLDSRLLLIEFKLDDTCFDSEKAKFKDYAAAETALAGLSGHHFFVYGKAVLQNAQEHLELRAQGYFPSGPRATKVHGVVALTDYGVVPSTFDEYLTALLQHKHPDGRSTGTLGPEDMKPVVCVWQDGVAVGAMSVSDYVSKYIPTLSAAPATPAPIPAAGSGAASKPKK